MCAISEQDLCKIELTVVESSASMAADAEPLSSITGALDEVAEPGEKGISLVQRQELGEYELYDVLGEGGMGKVFRARRKGTEFDVALKVLHSTLSQDELTRKRLAREARAASLLTHVNLVGIYETAEAEGCAFLSLELIDGRTLADILETDGPLGVSEFENIFSQVCDGLMHAHSKGILHRDIKASNILVTAGGNVKIADFGISAAIDEHCEIGQTKLTATYSIIGSPAYMSPEQCLGHDLDQRSDVYSLGVLMYQCLTGVMPFEGKNAIQLITRQINDVPLSLRSRRASIPQSIEEVVLRCLEKDPAARFPSAGDLLLALKYAAARPHKKLPALFRCKPKSKWGAHLAICALALMTVLCACVAYSKVSPAVVVRGTQVTPQASGTEGQVSQEQLSAWISQLSNTSEPVEVVALCKLIGNAYLTLSREKHTDVMATLDAESRNYVLQAIAYFLRAEKTLLVQGSAEDLDTVYEALYEANQMLDHDTQALHYAQLRCKLAESKPELLKDSTVIAFSNLAGALNKLGRSPNQVIADLRKAIQYDKQLHGKSVGNFVSPCYYELASMLAIEGDRNGELAVLNEQVEREAQRWGRNSFLLSYSLKEKREVLKQLGRKKEAELVTKRLALLDKEPDEETDKIKGLKAEILATSEPGKRARLLAEVGARLYHLAFPTEESFRVPLDSVRRNHLLEAIMHLEGAESGFLAVNHSMNELDEVYVRLCTGHQFLLQNRQMLAMAQKRCDLHKNSNQPPNELTVQAYTDLAIALNANCSSTQIVNDACRKAIELDRSIHADRTGDWIPDAYCLLSDNLEGDGRLTDALNVTDEFIKRMEVRYGKGSSRLATALATRESIVKKLKR